MFPPIPSNEVIPGIYNASIVFVTVCIHPRLAQSPKYFFRKFIPSDLFILMEGSMGLVKCSVIYPPLECHTE